MPAAVPIDAETRLRLRSNSSCPLCSTAAMLTACRDASSRDEYAPPSTPPSTIAGSCDFRKAMIPFLVPLFAASRAIHAPPKVPNPRYVDMSPTSPFNARFDPSHVKSGRSSYFFINAYIAMRWFNGASWICSAIGTVPRDRFQLK